METSLVGVETLVMISDTHIAHKGISTNDPQLAPVLDYHDGGPFVGYAVVINSLHPTYLCALPMVMHKPEELTSHTPVIPTEGRQMAKDQHQILDTLPSEVWIAAAECLSRNSLLQLVAVNRFFYETGMDILYAEVDLRLTNSVVKAKFNYIDQPHIAKRIRHLKLSIDYSLWSSPECARTSEQKTLLNAGNQYDMHPDEDNGHRSKSPEYFNFTQAMNIFLHALPNMRHVRKLSLRATETNALPSPYSLDAIFATIWKTSGTTLEKFSYRGTLPNLTSIFRSSPPPTIELDIEVLGSLSRGNIGFALFPDVSINHQTTSIDNLVSDLRRVSSQIRSLHFHSSPTEDLSPLYAKLKDFTTLQLTGLGLTSPTSTLSEPSALTELLTLVSPDLEQFTIYYPGSWSVPIFVDAEANWNNCLARCLSLPECFANVRVLNIYPTAADSGLDTLLAFIRNAELNLEEISVEHRYWGMGDIKKIIHALKTCKNLRSLKLSTLQYNNSLIDCLAHNLPNLRSLDLTIDGPSGNLQPRQYDHWKLYDLTICRKGSVSADKLMLELARQTPSLMSFNGNGNMDLDEFY